MGCFRPFEFKGHKYFVVYGYNPEMRIDTLNFRANEKNYSFAISGEEHYLFVYSYQQLVDYFPFTEVALIDREGNDISEEIYKFFESNEFRELVIESSVDIVDYIAAILVVNLLACLVVMEVYRRR